MKKQKVILKNILNSVIHWEGKRVINGSHFKQVTIDNRKWDVYWDPIENCYVGPCQWSCGPFPRLESA